MAVHRPHPPTPMCNAAIVLTFRDAEKWWRYIETQGTVGRSPVSCGSALLQADGPRTEYLAYCFDSVDMPTFDATCGVVRMCKIVRGPVTTYRITCLLVGHVHAIKKNYVVSELDVERARAKYEFAKHDAQEAYKLLQMFEIN